MLINMYLFTEINNNDGGWIFAKDFPEFSNRYNKLFSALADVKNYTQITPIFQKVSSEFPKDLSYYVNEIYRPWKHNNHINEQCYSLKTLLDCRTKTCMEIVGTVPIHDYIGFKITEEDFGIPIKYEQFTAFFNKLLLNETDVQPSIYKLKRGEINYEECLSEIKTKNPDIIKWVTNSNCFVSIKGKKTYKELYGIAFNVFLDDVKNIADSKLLRYGDVRFIMWFDDQN